jgi:putative permease
MKRIFGDLPGRIFGIAIVAAVIILLILTVQVLIVPVVGAIFLAYLLDPGVVALQRRGMGRGNAFIVLLGVCLVIVALALILLPGPLAPTAANGLNKRLPDRITADLDKLETWKRNHLRILANVNLSGSDVQKRLFDFAGKFATQLPGLAATFMVDILLIPLIAFFLARDGRTLRRKLVSMVPNAYFEMAVSLFYRIDQQIGGYLRGRLIECVLLGIVQLALMAATQAISGVPQPDKMLISVVSGVLNFIPYVGPILGAIFGTILYFGSENLPATSVWALYIVVAATHLIDNFVIAPAVLSHNVDLHPLTVVLALVIGGEVFGVLGLLIAIPVAASIKVIGQEFYANYQAQVR